MKAAALMRPSRSVLDIEPSSVKKKWKERKFAAGVNREVIEKGAAMLGADLDGLIADTIAGMRTAAKAIGLKDPTPKRARRAPHPREASTRHAQEDHMKGNAKLIETLNALLADELTAVNQYMVHAGMNENWGYGKLHDHFEKRAIEEMKHAERLIGSILFLEGIPIVSQLVVA